MRRMWMIVLAVVVLAAACIGAGCERFPRDPRGSLDRVLDRGVLHVGVTEAVPWVVRLDDGSAGGLESELVERLADELGVEILWHWDHSEHNFEALGRYELDVVIGGITSKNPWKKHAALTIAYFTDSQAVGVEQERAELDDLDGVTVGVGPTSALSEAIRDRGGIPQAVDELAVFAGPVAAEDWALEAMGRRVTRITLSRREHVMAVPQGENALLMRLESLLMRAMSEAEMRRRLREAWEARP